MPLQHACIERAKAYLDFLNQDYFFMQEEYNGLSSNDLPYERTWGNNFRSHVSTKPLDSTS